MVDGRAAAHRAKGKTIDFLILLERIAGELYAHIFQDTGVILSIIAAVLCAWTTLYLLCENAIVVWCLSAEDDTTPVSRLALSGNFLRCEYDWCCLSTAGDKLATRLSDECSLRLLITLDDCSRLYGQCCSVGNVNPSLQNICSLFQCRVTLEDKLLVAVTYLCSVRVVGTVLVENLALD